jgi:hypothetical protein
VTGAVGSTVTLQSSESEGSTRPLHSEHLTFNEMDIMKTLIFGSAIPVALFAAGLLPAPLGAEDQATAVTPTQLAKELVGTWVLIGQPGKVGEPPAKGARFKICAENHWTNAQADPETGRTIVHKGGTYTLVGDNYEETVEFDDDNPANFIKQTYKFTIKIEGDTLTVIGIGNPWREVLRRVKEKGEQGVEKR